MLKVVNDKNDVEKKNMTNARTVIYHNFNSHNFKSRVSNPNCIYRANPYVGYVAAILHSRTPSSHHKIFPRKNCSKGWVAQKPFLIGSLTAALRCSKGWVRNDLNLVMGIGCSTKSMTAQTRETRG